MVNGYLIVRKPNLVELYGGDFLKPYNNFNYQGMDRLMWFDIDNYFFTKEGEYNNIAFNEYKPIADSGHDGSFLKLANRISTVENLLSINNEIALNNEIIAIESSFLSEAKSKVEETNHISWIGYDIVLLGGWSLIRHGIFENNMSSLLKCVNLNRYGLFDSLDFVSNFLEEYNFLSKTDKVDKIIDSLILDTVRVGKPNSSKYVSND